MLAVIHKIFCLIDCNIISISFMRDLQKLCVFSLFTRLKLIIIILDVFVIWFLIWFIIYFGHSRCFLNFIKLSFFIIAWKLWGFYFFNRLKFIIISLDLSVICIIIWIIRYFCHNWCSFNFMLLRFFIVGICIIIFIIILLCLIKLLKSFSTFLSEVIFSFNLIMILEHVILIIIMIVNLNKIIVIISGWCFLVITSQFDGIKTIRNIIGVIFMIVIDMDKFFIFNKIIWVFIVILYLNKIV